MPVIKSQNGEIINPLSEGITDPRITAFFGDFNTEFWALDTITYGSVSDALTPFAVGNFVDNNGTVYTPFAFEAAHIAQAGDILDKIARFIDLDFVQAEGAEAPLLALALTDADFAGAGSATFPRTGQTLIEGELIKYGASLTIFYDEQAAQPEFNTYYYGVLMHELGHTLGLDHPHTGYGETFVSKLPAAYAGHDMTIMSFGYTQNFSSRFEGYYLAHQVTNWLPTDVIALQAIYGVDQTVTVGNDVYSFNEGETYYETLWDTSGIDEIVINSTQDTQVDLSKEGWINIGSSVQYLSRTGADPLTVNDTVYLMDGVIIEKFTGGSGNDNVTGNAEANTLIGNAGNDVLRGGEASDTLSGGSGNDALWAGAGDTAGDLMDGGEGNDVIGGGAGNDSLIGGAGGDTIFGGSGDDVIWSATNGSLSDTQGDFAWAGSGDDEVNGSAGADQLGGGAGNDTINGGAGADKIYGGVGDAETSGLNDSIIGGAGNDTIFGSDGNDVIIGENGNDLLFNGSGNDTVSGGANDDTIWGGGGDDMLTGGTGADTFTFAAGNGADTITDFDIQEDRLDLNELNLGGLSDITAIASDTVEGLLINFDDTFSILINNASVNDLENIQILF